MNAAIEKALYQLTHNGNLAEVGADILSQIAEEYPYFAPAQLLLAAKLKEESSYRAQNQLQKAALYFSNPSWLHYQLLTGEPKEIVFRELTQQPQIIDEPKQEQAPIQNEPITGTGLVIEEEPIPVDAPPALSLGTQALAQQPLSAIASMPSYTGAFQNIESKTEENAIAPEKDDHNEKLSSILSGQVADFKKPVDDNARLDFETEQYYTIDYFASQGIKADLTQQPQDKLTRQLLKFTDWLKMIKKDNPNPKDLGTDPELENAIKSIAQTSNEAKEIITETMAEVFVKQGRFDKAVQLYIKLSFLYPEKSSYFASKIQQLKGM